MNSGLRKLPIIGLAGFILIGIAFGSKSKTTPSEANPASLFWAGLPTPESQGYNITFESEPNQPKSLKDSIKEMANRLGKKSTNIL